ncbi:hypothetical protein AZE42_10556 [Rhizopogon vesiculosus]|uniref:Uncharacterized protein n=1 Tax=Rhizopogon vesiculosus TaxID=180088 RepID=A0A1J8QIV3_9AGAM|nr:hypothetical protein AZE42_10556 [Rhizopogon vesiculosus]
MSAHMKFSNIACVTHSNHRTINRALRLSRLTGSVVQKPLQAGCPRQLTPHDVKYLEACVEHTPARSTVKWSVQ